MKRQEKQQVKDILSSLFQKGLLAVNGQLAVERQLENKPIVGDISVIAVGKAAASMMRGAHKKLKKQIQSSLIITKAGHAEQALDSFCLEAGHPIPNQNSLKAGDKLLEFIRQIPPDTKLLALISGGASALVEVLPQEMNLEQLQKINQWLLSSGLDIHEMNRVRQAISLIKGGKALQYLSLDSMTQFLISDVEYDDPKIIGSGLFINNEANKSLSGIPDWIKEFVQSDLNPSNLEPSKVDVESYIVANNEMACQAIIEKAQKDYTVFDHGQILYGDVFELSEKIATTLLKAKSGIHIWGGEPTITLPDKIGRGGRNQSLALALACEVENIDGITILVGATDGSDGPTEDAGAIIDGKTLQRGERYSGQAKEYLVKADAGTFLAQAGDLLSTGPTGTNVMDIVIALKE